MLLRVYSGGLWKSAIPVLRFQEKTCGPLSLPGGATALIAVIGGVKVHTLGFFYAFVPAGTGAIILLVVALLVNNLSKHRKYPEYWL